jgi:hypothetical protein
MSVRTTTTLLNVFLALASLGLSQAGQQPLPTRTAAVESSNDSLPKAFQRIQVELKQTAEDIATVDASMSQQSRNGGSPTVTTASRIRELLKDDDPAMLIRDFLDATQDRLRFESCLKSGKLYRNLAAEIFRTPLPEAGQATGKSTLGDSFAQVAQLFFLSRMIPELALQYGEFQSRTKAVPDAKQVELWQKLREALRHDDQLLLAKLSAFLASAGESPNRFAVRVLSQAHKTSPWAAATIVESMAILNAAGDVWKLAEIPGINPVFLTALECEKRAMNSVPVAGFQAALRQSLNCRASADGSSVQAFAAHPPQPVESTSKAPPSGPNESPHSRDIFRLPTEKELKDLQSQDSTVDTAPTSPSQPSGFGVSNTPVKRPKIPSWWIRCACPSDHPDAGIVFEGVRWHAPVLQCPNPELRRLEVK